MTDSTQRDQNLELEHKFDISNSSFVLLANARYYTRQDCTRTLNLQMVNTYQTPSRFYSLDVLRGGLTFFIIFFHWQHFFYDGGQVSEEFEYAAQPLFWLLKPLYTQGIYAVDFFFSLSGFIFFWLYADPIRNGSVSVAKYAALRFSRLYPLHIATLLLVIVGQYAAVAQTGGYLVYQENDWYHLLLNLFFINAWGFQDGFSFNGPSWTVSVEVLMYISFFLLAYFCKPRLLLVAATLIAAIGFYIEFNVDRPMGMGFHSFFVGGVAYILYTKLMNLDLKRVLAVLLPLSVILWAIAITDMYMTHGVSSSIQSVVPELFFHRVIDFFDSSLFATIVVIPLTIIVLAVLETIRGSLGKRIHVIGDMSYALYLLHFPLQILFILVANWLGVDRAFFYSVTSVLLFYIILWPLSYLSYFYFEYPCQKYLRRVLIKR